MAGIAEELKLRGKIRKILSGPAVIILLFSLFGIFPPADKALATDDAVIEAIQCRIRGYIYQRQGDFNKAMENYQKAVQRNPSYACAHNDIGVLYEQKGMFDKAEQRYLKAIQIDPNYASAYSNLAMFYERKEKYDIAAYYWAKRAEMGDPNDRWTQNAGQKYAEVCLILADEQKKRKTTQLKDIVKNQAKERKQKKHKKAGPEAFKTEEEAILAEASDLAEELAQQKAIDKKRKAEDSEKQKQKEKKCQEYLNSAKRFLEKGSYDSAIRQYEKIKAVIPDYPGIGNFINEARDAKAKHEHHLTLQREEKQKARQKIKSPAQALPEREIQKEQERIKKEQEKLKKQQELEEKQKSAAQALAEKERQKEQERIKKEQESFKRQQGLGQRQKAEEQERVELQRQKEQERLKKEQERLKRQQELEEKQKAKEQARAELQRQKEQERLKRQQELERRRQSEEQERIRRQGQSLQEREQVRKAQEAREKELQAKKEFASQAEKEKIKQRIEGLLNKAEDYTAGHKYDLAMMQYYQIEKLDPNFDDLKGLMKQAEDAKSRYEAERQLKAREEKLLKEQEKKRREQKKIAGQIDAHLKKAEEYLSRNKYDAAVLRYQRVAMLDPDYPGLQDLINNAKPAQIQIQKKEQAAQKIEEKKTAEPVKPKEKKQVKIKPETIEPESKEIQRRVGEAEKKREEAQQQQESRVMQKQQLKEAARHLARGQNLYLASRYEDAAKELELALAANPNDVQANRLLRYCQRRLQYGYYRPLQETVINVQPQQLQEGQAAAPPAPKVELPARPSAPSVSKTVTQEVPSEVEKRIAQEVQKENKQSSALSPVDIEKKYQVMGVVAYRSESNEADALNEELLKKSKAIGAEEIIQVRYFQHNNYIYGYGTAVKKRR